MEQKSPEQKFISLKGVTLRVRDRLILPDTDWVIKTDQNWAILGPNGVGKSSLVGALAGHVPVVKGKLVRHLPEALAPEISYVSFDLEQRLIARDIRLDDARFFSGDLDSFAQTRSIIRGNDPSAQISETVFAEVIDLLDIRRLLGRGIRFLSTGEMRKILIARALVKSPGLLILDEPFAGLDVYSKAQLKEIIDHLNGKCRLVLVAHRFQEITSNITHILCLKNNTVFLQGPRERVLASEKMDRLYEREKPLALSFPLKKTIEIPFPDHPPRVLVKMQQVTVKYDDLLVLDKLDWTVRERENWAVLGPNGSGKTTLLNLIMGDNPQAYANKIYLFGRRRGSGESIWDIKKKIAFVSAHLQINYRKKIRAFDVVLSGFFDSIGLYRRATSEQRATAAQWVENLGIAGQADKMFDQLSYGERRLVLIARAMVKTPVLLILDEPCQGLDKVNRRMVLDLVELVGTRSDTRLIYVTHHPDEIPPCITHILRLHIPHINDK